MASVKILSELYKKFQSNKSVVEFNFHDIWKLVKGLTFSTPDTAPDIPTMIRLWVHEASFYNLF